MRKAVLILAFVLGMSSLARAQQKQVLSVAGATCTVTGTTCLINNVDPAVGGATFTVSANASGNTLQFEASGDGTTTWVALNVTPSNGTSPVTSTTSTGTWQANVAGFTNVRIRMSTLVSGTSTVSIIFSIASARSGGGTGGGGSGIVSGQANNVIPKGTTATSITQQSSITDNGTTVSTAEALSITGGASTFNNAAGSGALDVILGLLNRIHLSCNNGSGYRFATIEAGNSDILTNATQGGYNFICPDNSTDTITSQDEIGSNTKTVVVDLHPGNIWTSNFTSSATYLWGLHNGSAIVGAQNGTRGSTAGSRTGGAYLFYPCNANTTYGLTTAEGITTIQAYGMLQHVNIEGCATGTVGAGSPTIALLNWEGISSFNTIEDDYVFGFANTVGCRFASNNAGSNGALLGPLVIKNLWCNGLNNTGAQPWKVTTTSGSCSAILPISIVGGVANDSGSSLPNFEVNGQACPGRTISAGIVTGMHSENLNSGLTPIHFKIVDTSNWMFEATHSHMASSGETGFDISQSGAGLTCAISLFHNLLDSNAVTTINNHISGFTETGQGINQGYIFGGDSTCNLYPWIFDSQSIELLNTASRASFFDIYKTTDPTTNFTRFRIDNSESATAAVVLTTRHGGTGNLSAITLDPDSGNVNFNSNGTAFLQISSGSLAFKCLSATACDIGTNTTGQQFRNFYVGGTLQSSFGSSATLTGTGACATFSGQVGGEMAGSAACASATAASTLTIGSLPAAAHGYVCHVQDETNRANLFQQTSHSTTSCVLTATSVTQNDVFVFTAFGF